MRRAVAGIRGLVALLALIAATATQALPVRLQHGYGLTLDAALDARSAGNTLQAQEREFFHRDGSLWLRLAVDAGGVVSGARMTFERPVLRDDRIRLRDGSTTHRPLIALTLCVGDRLLDITASVVERRSHGAPLRLGRRTAAALGEVAVVPAPDCPPPLPAAGEGEGEGDAADVIAGDAVDDAAARSDTNEPAARKPSFRCDGRRYCSEMGSRAEAEFFVRHCPDTRMDGDRDGEPCENDSRW